MVISCLVTDEIPTIADLTTFHRRSFYMKAANLLAFAPVPGMRISLFSKDSQICTYRTDSRWAMDWMLQLKGHPKVTTDLNAVDRK